MSDFDWLLERKLKQMLDPVVAAPAPPRRGRAQAWPPFGLPAVMFGHTQRHDCVEPGEEALFLSRHPLP